MVRTLLAGAESAEVGGCGGDNVVVELESDAAHGLTASGDIEEDVGHDEGDLVVCGMGREVVVELLSGWDQTIIQPPLTPHSHMLQKCTEFLERGSRHWITS
jgi:hypothetical protein